MVSLGFRGALGTLSDGVSCKDVSYIFFNERSYRQTITLESPSVAFLRTLILGGAVVGQGCGEGRRWKQPESLALGRPVNEYRGRAS